MLTEIAQKTRLAAQQLASLSTDAKNAAIESIAKSLASFMLKKLSQQMRVDCQAAEGENWFGFICTSQTKRHANLTGAIVGVRDVGKLADPVGQIQIHRELDAGLIMHRISCPVGVLGVIFEARPDAVIQIASLAIKSGNGVILKRW